MMEMADSLWAWVSEYPDGSIGCVGALLPGMEHVPLITRSERTARQLERFAREHGEKTGQRVWLRRYDKAEDYP